MSDLHRNGDARRIIDGSGAEIPGIEMTADNDHFVRFFASLYVGDPL
jgi:hypothetical protein